MVLKEPFQHFPDENQSQDGLKQPNIWYGNLLNMKQKF
jgi:hypothetical protein